jgi:hypothetical protein
MAGHIGECRSRYCGRQLDNKVWCDRPRSHSGNCDADDLYPGLHRYAPGSRGLCARCHEPPERHAAQAGSVVGSSAQKGTGEALVPSQGYLTAAGWQAPAAPEVPNVGGAGGEAPCPGSAATPSLDTYGTNSTAAPGEPYPASVVPPKR